MLWAVAFGFRRLCSDVIHPPVPLKRGDLEASLLLLMSCLVSYNSPLERGGWDTDFSLIMGSLVCMFPLWRGDKGVCYGEMCG